MISFQWLVVVVSIGYLLLLFWIAFFVESRKNLLERIKNSSLIYALSLAIYCTAWTFYGSIGAASKSGLNFLAIYLGPTLFMPFWYMIVLKINRIAKANNVTTFADFLSVRYSKSINLGMFITILMIIGIIPYISLQIKAISESFRILMMTSLDTQDVVKSFNVPLIVTIIMGIFIIFFATRKMETTEHHTGLVASIAFESVFKLIAFITAGIVITYLLFDGHHDLYQSVVFSAKAKEFFTFSSSTSMSDWAGMALLSGIAVTLLPRQFQVSVIENTNDSQIRTAVWAFPLYLFLINLFVIPVAIAGTILLSSNSYSPDYYLLQLPLNHGMKYIALLVFLGGFSAAAAMIIIETLALSNMLSNNFIIPLILKLGVHRENISGRIASQTLMLRRFSVITILGFTLIYYNSLSPYYSLVSIGLISFVFIAQFFPSILGALYLKSSHHRAVFVSITVGFVIWLYTLIFPSIIENTVWGQSIIQHGLFGLSIFKPKALFGLEIFSPVMHSFFWSMFFNVFSYVIVTLYYQPTNYEKQQAHIYVDVFKYGSIEETQVVWREIAAISDIRSLLIKFLGEEKTTVALNSFSKRYNINLDSDITTDPKLIPFVERLLSKIVGTVSARILIESVMKDKDIYINEMMDIIQESKEIITLNRELVKKSNELEKAKIEVEKINNQLILHDQTKDEFLATVSHELKSPLTSISSFSEILHDNEDLSSDEVNHFSGIISKESIRLTRLINQLLDLEKYDSGKQFLMASIVNLDEFFEDILNVLKPELDEKKIKVDLNIDSSINELIFDKDKMMQVFINLLNNAIKFSPEGSKLYVNAIRRSDHYYFDVKDKGNGIDPLYHQLIFEKFFQAKDQSLKKPKGSGLGLAICRKIVHLHQGRIYVQHSDPNGTIFAIELPITEYRNA